MTGTEEKIADILYALGNTSIGHLLMAVLLVMVVTGLIFVWGFFSDRRRSNKFNEALLALFAPLSAANTAIGNAMSEIKEQTRLTRMAVEKSTDVDEQTSIALATNTASIDHLGLVIAGIPEATQQHIDQSLQTAMEPLVLEMGALRETIERVDQKSADRLGEITATFRELLDNCARQPALVDDPRPTE